jgi:hypothetical protein
MYTDTVKMHAARLSCTELSMWEFPFLRGPCWQGGNSTVDNVAYTFVSYRRLSPPFQFSLSGAATPVYLYQWSHPPEPTGGGGGPNSDDFSDITFIGERQEQ